MTLCGMGVKDNTVSSFTVINGDNLIQELTTAAHFKINQSTWSHSINKVFKVRFH